MRGGGLLLAGLLAVVDAEAASLTLDEQAMSLAVAVGQRSVTSEASFDAEWRVTGRAGEIATVVTPFHRIVLAARHAAFKGEALPAAERTRALRDQKERLPFWVVLRGPRADFARHYSPSLIVRDQNGAEREIAPSFVQNERTALKQDDGQFVARCIYTFPTKEITGTSRGDLIVRDAEGREVTRFPLDLSRMR